MSNENNTVTLDHFQVRNQAGGNRGARTFMEDGSGSTTWTYDARVRVIREEKTITGSGTYTTEWGYNPADMVAWMKYPEGNTGAAGEQVSFAYYPQMALKRVAGDATYLDEAAYDEMGRMVTRKLGSSLPTTIYSYFDVTTQGGRLMNTTTGLLQDLSYTYDPNGNILSITDGRAGGDAPLTFGYDAADRLDWMGINGAISDNPVYDANGRLAQKGTGTTINYLNTINAATSTSDGRSFGYDANGNMITRVIGGVTYTLTYDAENRLVGYAGGSINATFTYDGDGKRVKGTVNGVTTTYVGNHYEVQGTTTRKYYFAGTQRIAVREIAGEINTLSFFLSDHLGSTAITVSETGNRTGELRYSAWGETRYEFGATPTNARYTGQMAEPDLNGLYYYGARWYDVQLGRFISPDTIIPGAGNPQAWDRYAYVNNNSVNGTDPTGHCIDGVTTAICIAMAAGAIAGYAIQVGENRAQGMDWGAALTTNISGEKILAGAVIGGGVIVAAAAASVGIAAVGAVGAAACVTSGACSKMIPVTGGAANEIALDTNAVIAATEGGAAEVSAVTNAMAGRTPVIPPTVANEFLTRGSSSVLNNFIQNNSGRIGSAPLLSQVQALQQQAASLGRSLRTPDASVAASALRDGVSLLTADARLVNTLRAIGVPVEHLVIRK